MIVPCPTCPVPFLTRRARLLRQETQEQFADYLRVDPSTVSRWETGQVEPHPTTLARIRDTITSYNPAGSLEFVRRSSTLKYVCLYRDFKHGITCSKGLAEMHDMTIEEVIAKSEEFWTEDNDRVNTIVQANTQWKNGEVAFIETVHEVAIGWVMTVAAPMEDTGCVLWEGVLLDDTNPHHPARIFKVALYPSPIEKPTTRAQSHMIPH